jgi:hypothetical protein
MSAELEKIRSALAAYREVVVALGNEDHAKKADEALREYDALLQGKVLVPVDTLNSVMELAGVALVYQPFGTKDRQHFDTLIQIAASQEQGK